jgi:Ca2+-transporting ATPase
MEVAFHASADQAGAGIRPGMDLVRTHGLTPELLAMGNVWRDGPDPLLTVAAKGAPEAVARLCGLAGKSLPRWKRRRRRWPRAGCACWAWPWPRPGR